MGIFNYIMSDTLKPLSNFLKVDFIGILLGIKKSNYIK